MDVISAGEKIFLREYSWSSACEGQLVSLGREGVREEKSTGNLLLQVEAGFVACCCHHGGWWSLMGSSKEVPPIIGCSGKHFAFLIDSAS